MSKRFLSVLFIPLFLIASVFFVSSNRYAYAFKLNYGTCQVPSDSDCADLLLTYTPGDPQFANTRVSGTLLGVSNFLQGASSTQPSPANLAFWWNDNVNRIPFAGRALAAETTYSGPFLTIILGVWKLARDVSYGLMALVMLAVGFMIITRKKIGPQAAVTAQQALPRIIIALVLITFSYPIGALGASAAFVLRGNTADIVNHISWTDITPSGGPSTREISCDPDRTIFEKIALFVTNLDIRRTVLNFMNSFIFDGIPFTAFGKTGSEMAACGVKFLETNDASVVDSTSQGKMAAILYAVVGGLIGNGPLALLIAIIVILAAVVFAILVYIKFFILYLKLLFSIIGAPLQFAFGAIPGNEAVTTNWFKGFAALVISMPAMWFVFQLSGAIAIKAIAIGLADTEQIGGGALMLLIIPFFYIFGANFARTLPEKIDAMIVGEPKKGGKR